MYLLKELSSYHDVRNNIDVVENLLLPPSAKTSHPGISSSLERLHVALPEIRNLLFLQGTGPKVMWKY